MLPDTGTCTYTRVLLLMVCDTWCCFVHYWSPVQETDKAAFLVRQYIRFNLYDRLRYMYMYMHVQYNKCTVYL